jgi:hypothetical protein
LICTDSVQAWIPNKDYLYGSLVQWKNNNYVATQDVIGATTFQYGQFQLISTTFTNSILPNLSLKSIDYVNSYNINYRPFLTDLVNLRNNTIGYIERDWLTILDIDLGGQTDFYKGWIKEKGSLNSLNSYGRGSTPQLNTVVEVNEEYAMKVGVYGSDLRTGYGDVSLPPIINTQNPLIISFVSSPNSADSNSIQVTPHNLYEKSANWNNDLIQYYGNLVLETSSFTSGGPVIPQAFIAAAQNTIPSFIKTDEPYLFFPTLDLMTAAPQDSVLKIAENGGSFWIENNPLAPGPNQWDVIIFSAASTAIASITQLNANTISFILSNNIGVTANSIIVIDYTDVGANISISGSFVVNDYFIAPFITANTIGYSNLSIITSPNQFGNVFVNYPNPVPTSDIYVSRSLRSDSIAEGDIISGDSTQYVVNDVTGEAAYDLTVPYQTEITYTGVSGGIAINSLAYDSPNQLLWSGKPNYAPSGVVELRIVAPDIISIGNVLPTIDTVVYILQPQNPNSFNLGRITVAANNFAAATADTSGIPSQIYICRNNSRSAPSVAQILNGNTSSSYQINGLAVSADGNWLYAVEEFSSGVSQIAVYALQTNANVGQSWFPNYSITGHVANTSITVNHVIPNEYAITVLITDYSKRVLIPSYEYTVAGNVININGVHAGTTYVGDPNHTFTVTGLPSFYQYQGTLNPIAFGLSQFGAGSQFGASIACDSTGTLLAVGAPAVGSGNVVIFSRVTENQYANASGYATPINTFETITSVLINGLPVPQSAHVAVSAGTLIEFQGYCFNVDQVISAPNTTDSGFGTSVAIENNQLVVGSTNTTIGNQFNKGTGYFYALDTAITSTKIIPLIDLSLSTIPFMINGWVCTPATSTVIGLINAINAISGYTGINASIQNSNLVLNIDSVLQSSGIGLLGA